MTTIIAQVNATDDDAQQRMDGADSNYTGVLMNASSEDQSPTVNHHYRAGLRFTDLPIPNGPVVDSAFVLVATISDTADDANVELAMEDIDNGTGFSSSTLYTRPATTAFVDWVADALGVGVFQSPDIRDPVQEVLDRVGWAEGNAANVLFTGKTDLDKTFFLTTFDLGQFSELHITFHTSGQEVGDEAVYRHAAGGETYADGATWTEVPFDTEVLDPGVAYFRPNNTTVELTAGYYFVSYNLAFDKGGGNDNLAMLSGLTVNDTISAYGVSNGRTATAAGEATKCHCAASTILSVATDDDVSVVCKRQDTNTDDDLTAQADRSAVNFLKLLDTWDYARVRSSTATFMAADPNWTNVAWDTIDQEDAGSYDIDLVADDEIINLTQPGHYLVCVQVEASAGSNQNRAMELQLAIATPTFSFVNVGNAHAFVRGVDGETSGFASMATIIYADAPKELIVRLRHEGTQTSGGRISNAAITIVRLPSSSRYIRARSNSEFLIEPDGSPIGDDVHSAVRYLSQDETDDAFTMDAQSGAITLERDAGDGTYLMLLSSYYRTMTTFTGYDMVQVVQQWYSDVGGAPWVDDFSSPGDDDLSLRAGWTGLAGASGSIIDASPEAFAETDDSTASYGAYIIDSDPGHSYDNCYVQGTFDHPSYVDGTDTISLGVNMDWDSLTGLFMHGVERTAVNTLRLFKVDQDVITTMDTYVGYTPGTIVKLERDGPMVNVYVGGVRVMSEAADETFVAKDMGLASFEFGTPAGRDAIDDFEAGVARTAIPRSLAGGYHRGPEFSGSASLYSGGHSAMVYQAIAGDSLQVRHFMDEQPDGSDPPQSTITWNALMSGVEIESLFGAMPTEVQFDAGSDAVSDATMALHAVRPFSASADAVSDASMAVTLTVAFVASADAVSGAAVALTVVVRFSASCDAISDSTVTLSKTGVTLLSANSDAVSDASVALTVVVRFSASADAVSFTRTHLSVHAGVSAFTASADAVSDASMALTVVVRFVASCDAVSEAVLDLGGRSRCYFTAGSSARSHATFDLSGGTFSNLLLFTMYLADGFPTDATFESFVATPTKLTYAGDSLYLIGAMATVTQHQAWVALHDPPGDFDGSVAMARDALRQNNMIASWWLFDHFAARKGLHADGGYRIY